MKNSTEGNRKRMKKYHLAKHLFVTGWKAARGCQVCGERDPIVLELHHPKGTIKHPRLMFRNNRCIFSRLSWGLLQEEVSKCMVLCANCHRRITYRERQT